MYLVGVNYFNGWDDVKGSKWEHDGKDWRPEYPERVPLLGSYNNVKTLEMEIDAASKYGIDFFKMLWYIDTPPREENVDILNTCFDNFKQARNNDKIKFCIEYCNHEPFGIEDDELWIKTVERWIKIMNHPSYLRVNNRPVFCILWIHYFFVQCGSDVSICKHRLDYLRKAVMQSGLGELLIGGGIIMEKVIEETTGQILDLFDFADCYNTIPDTSCGLVAISKRDKRYSYKTLDNYVYDRWGKVQSQIKIPFVPFIVSGWNPAPWNKDLGHYFNFPTRKEWKKTLLNTKLYLDKNVSSHVCGVKMLTIYAWNEYGEGGIVAPTNVEGYMKLEEIKKVFKTND